MQYEAFASVAIPRKLKLSLSADEINKILKPCLQKSCRKVKEYAQNHHGYKDNTGKLTRAISYMITSNVKKRYELDAKIYIKDNIAKVAEKYGGYGYGKFVVNGTGIHGGKGAYPIYPRYKKALKLWDGRIVHHVKAHPGSKRYAFLDNAIRRTRADIRRIFEEGLEEAFGKRLKIK